MIVYHLCLIHSDFEIFQLWKIFPVRFRAGIALFDIAGYKFRPEACARSWRFSGRATKPRGEWGMVLFLQEHERKCFRQIALFCSKKIRNSRDDGRCMHCSSFLYAIPRISILKCFFTFLTIWHISFNIKLQRTKKCTRKRSMRKCGLN